MSAVPTLLVYEKREEPQFLAPFSTEKLSELYKKANDIHKGVISSSDQKKPTVAEANPNITYIYKRKEGEGPRQKPKETVSTIDFMSVKDELFELKKKYKEDGVYIYQCLCIDGCSNLLTMH